MTDVLILHRIPGLIPGRIVPIDDRLRGHVAAGNARILPIEHDPHVVPEPVAAPLLHMTTLSDQLADEDEGTEED